MSRLRLVTRATLTPGASSSSNRVTDGPTTIPTSRVSTPCSARACSRVRPCSSTSRRSISWAPLRLSTESGGSLHGDALDAGPRSIASCSLSGGSPSAAATWTSARACAGAGFAGRPYCPPGRRDPVGWAGVVGQRRRRSRVPAPRTAAAADMQTGALGRRHVVDHVPARVPREHDQAEQADGQSSGAAPHGVNAAASGDPTRKPSRPPASAWHRRPRSTPDRRRPRGAGRPPPRRPAQSRRPAGAAGGQELVRPVDRDPGTGVVGRGAAGISPPAMRKTPAPISPSGTSIRSRPTSAPSPLVR